MLFKKQLNTLNTTQIKYLRMSQQYTVYIIRFEGLQSAAERSCRREWWIMGGVVSNAVEFWCDYQQRLLAYAW